VPEDQRDIENLRERDERDPADAPGDAEDAPPARREPTREEAASEHRRRPGDDAWSDDEMVDRARK
jgi:hypothetical protein